MSREIEYFFSIGSPWSYIGLDPFIALAAKRGVTVKPYITTVVEENGGVFSRNRPEVRRAYWLRDLKRWAGVRGHDLWIDKRPQLSDPTPASLFVIAAYLDGQDWVGVTRALQHALWVEAADIGRPDIRAEVVQAAGFDGEKLLKRQSDDDVQAKWSSDRAHARDTGVFGFPTFIYENETYWGQDNLGFLERHLDGDRP